MADVVRCQVVAKCRMLLRRTTSGSGSEGTSELGVSEAPVCSCAWGDVGFVTVTHAYCGSRWSCLRPTSSAVPLHLSTPSQGLDILGCTSLHCTVTSE